MQEQEPLRTLSDHQLSELDDFSVKEQAVLPSDADSAREDVDIGPKGFGRAVLRETFQVIAPALILALVVHLFLAQATIVFGQSMEPNLSQNQRLIVDKISYRLRPPLRDDIIVLDLPEMDEMLVKRIVGLPGEVVEVREGAVYVDGEALPESYPHDLTPFDMEAILLGPLNYFVLGDNRGNSNDSRVFGPVHREHILGRVWLRYWPIDQLTLF